MPTAASRRQRYDLLVIGSGPAGIHAAVQAAKLGKQVGIIEAVPGKIGGAWIHTGTIPSKTLREILAAIHSIRSHVGSHWVDRIVDNLSSTRLIQRAAEVCREEETLIRRHIESNNIDIITGYGRIEDARTIRVAPPGSEAFLLEAEVMVIATGSKPRRPPDMPFDGWRVVDSDEILRLENLPRSIVVFGAGVIGCEYACIFGALGIETLIVDARTRIMQNVDREISEELKRSMEELGVRFKLGATLKTLDVSGPRPISVFTDESVTSDVFFFAAGRESTTRHLGLERVGITTNDRGAIVVNEFFQTSVPNIYAAGDAIGPPALAATSTEQGRLAVCHAFGGSTRPFPKVYPVGVYTIPELSSVGKSEEELKAEGVDYVVGHASFEEIARGYIRGDKTGMLKLLACRKTQRLLGIHIVGADAANLIHIGLCCMISGMPLQEIVGSMIFNYPTLAEGYRVAAFNALNKIFPSGTIKDAPADPTRAA